MHIELDQTDVTFGILNFVLRRESFDKDFVVLNLTRAPSLLSK